MHHSGCIHSQRLYTFACRCIIWWGCAGLCRLHMEKGLLWGPSPHILPDPGNVVSSQRCWGSTDIREARSERPGHTLHVLGLK